MAAKQEIAEKGREDAGIVINNAFIDGLARQLEGKMAEGMIFPEDYSVSNALTGAYLYLKEATDKNGKPLLETCTAASIANSLIDMATLGLSVQKKQGYLIAYGDKCQFQKSYFGNITIARRYGLESVNAQIIYEGDEFLYHFEDGIIVLDRHAQSFGNINGKKMIGAYAVAKMKDGPEYLELMTTEQIKQCWQQGYGYKETGGAHAKFADQMAKKTVINRAMKYIINTYGDGFVQDADSRTDEIDPETRVVADAEYEISQNANAIEFPAAEIPAQETGIPRADAPAPGRNGGIPPFMRQETM